jgi:hypothetical protein
MKAAKRRILEEGDGRNGSYLEKGDTERESPGKGDFVLNLEQ